MIKNFSQFNESFKEIEEKYHRDIDLEIQKKFRSINKNKRPPMIKNFNQFNESLKEIRDNYLEEVRDEIQKEFRPIIDFAHEINDILVNYEDEGFEYEFNQIYCDEGDHDFWFRIDLEKNKIELSDDDILSISQDPEMFYNFINGDIHFCLEIEWDDQIEQKLVDQIVGMYPFVQDGLINNHIYGKMITFKFKKEDLE